MGAKYLAWGMGAVALFVAACGQQQGGGFATPKINQADTSWLQGGGGAAMQAGSYAPTATQGLDQLQGSLDQLAKGGGDADGDGQSDGELTSQQRDALTEASGAVSALKKAYQGGLTGVHSPGNAQLLQQLLVEAERRACNAGMKLASAGFPTAAIAFFRLCETDLVWEVQIRKPNFARDTQTNSLVEVARLISQWGYQAAFPVYRVYKASRPYEQEPPQLAEKHFPRQVVALYRCWDPGRNYFFVTTDPNCEGRPIQSNNPEPMSIRRKLGYLSKESSGWTPIPIRRYQNLRVPNDLLSAFDARGRLLQSLGYTLLANGNSGIVGYGP